MLLSFHLVVVAGSSAANPPRDLPGEIFDREVNAEELLETRLKRTDPHLPITTVIQLPALSRAEQSRLGMPKVGTPLQIGVHRDVPVEWAKNINPAELAWESLADGSLAATLSISSPGASAIRVATRFHGLPAGAQVRYYAPDSPDRAFGPYDRKLLSASSDGVRGDGLFWSPVVPGDTIAVEIFAPNGDAASEVWIAFTKISHVLQSPFDSSFTKDIGDSGRCNKDLACTPKWETTGESVARIVFETSQGGAVCTGQLVNHTNSNRNLYYMLTARHCINKKNEARSATFLWFFQRAQCKGTLSTSVKQTAGGAKLKFKSPPVGRRKSTDHSLLQLKRAPPSGVTWSGWSDRDPLTLLDEKAKGIHHPNADLKKLSKGEIIEVFQLDTFQIRPPLTHLVVEWKKGVTEQGSSGSGIWIGTAFPNQYLVGVLTGGLSSCQFKKDPDWYGLFSQTMERNKKFRRLLDPARSQARPPARRER